MVFKAILIVMVILVLSEDTASIKKSLKEEKEDRELAEAVNRTLADEEKKKKEEENIKKEEDEKKKEKKLEDPVASEGSGGGYGGRDEALPSSNLTCPTVDPCEPCLPEKPCPEVKECPEPKECGPCPSVRPCKPCKPCGPCPVDNTTTDGRLGNSSPPTCPETDEASMSVPLAMAVGACAGLLVTGVVTAIGLLLRYAPPIFSGLLFLSIVVLTWYLSSHYPETARDLGGRVVATLREATIALGHRVMEAVRHHNEQVGLLVKPNLFL
jgi:hypothetical protein